MPRSDKQKLKLIYIIRMLMEMTDENHGITLKQIADGLAEEDIKAERKSLYSDIDILREAGYDIEAYKEGKEYLYRLASRDFELSELKLLVDAVQSSKFITEKKSNNLIKKIESLTSVHEAKSLHRQVYVANRIKSTNESVFYAVDDIQRAIAGNKKIQFKYFQWNTHKEKELRHDGAIYEISPWGLTWDDENYYMTGYDSVEEKIKHYRVDKMLKVKMVEDSKREGRELFKNLDMAVYSKKIFGMFGGDEQTVTLKCRDDMAGIIIDRFGSEVNIKPTKSGHFTARVSVQVSPQFFGWIFSLGDGVQITAPESVVKKMRAEIKNMAKQYK